MIIAYLMNNTLNQTLVEHEEEDCCSGSVAEKDTILHHQTSSCKKFKNQNWFVRDWRAMCGLRKSSNAYGHWQCNEAIKMHACKLSMGLEKLKFG